MPLRFLIAAIAIGFALSDTSVAQAERGRYLATLGDCASCHSLRGQPPFSGGVPLSTPVGTIYSTNITPDRETGIGAWSPDEFYEALHEGARPDGGHLYPAFPYPHFTLMSRNDTDALFAYLKTVPPVQRPPKANALPLPLQWRGGLAIWNAINFHPGAFHPDPARSAAWNRGAFLVRGPGHCGACHTPRTTLYAEDPAKPFWGATIDNWFAPDLTGNRREGLGPWSAADIEQFLKTGANAHAHVVGSMIDVIKQSTSQMTDDDRKAIATYLKSLPPSRLQVKQEAFSAQSRANGAAIFLQTCSECHQAADSSPPMGPNLSRETMIASRDPTTVIRVILKGVQSYAAAGKPLSYSMPAFPWLSDRDIADVASFIRSDQPVSPKSVKELRSRLASAPH